MQELVYQIKLLASRDSVLMALALLWIATFLCLLMWLNSFEEGNVGVFRWIGLSVIFHGGTMLGLMIGRDMEAVLTMALSILLFSILTLGWLQGMVLSILCFLSMTLAFSFGFLLYKLRMIKF